MLMMRAYVSHNVFNEAWPVL